MSDQLYRVQGAQVKAKAVSREKVIALAQFLVIAGIATFAPLFNFQLVTGPLVNAMLFIAVVVLGVRMAIVISLFPSLVAMSIGLLPIVLAPMVPFIMFGNIVLVLVFSYLWDNNYWFGVVGASVVKFMFLWLSSTVVTQLILESKVAEMVAGILSWPQLVTALGGGVLAYIFLKSIKKI